MPTDVLAALAVKRAAGRAERQQMQMVLVLVPVICCLASILLVLQSPAFEAVVVAVGTLQ